MTPDANMDAAMAVLVNLYSTLVYAQSDAAVTEVFTGRCPRGQIELINLRGVKRIRHKFSLGVASLSPFLFGEAGHAQTNTSFLLGTPSIFFCSPIMYKKVRKYEWSHATEVTISFVKITIHFLQCETIQCCNHFNYR